MAHSHATNQKTPHKTIPVNKMIDVQARAVKPTKLVLHVLVGAQTTATQDAT